MALWAGFQRQLTKTFQFIFPANMLVFSLQISVHRNLPPYWPNYFGHLSQFVCANTIIYELGWGVGGIGLGGYEKNYFFFTRIQTYNLRYQLPDYSVLPTRPCTAAHDKEKTQNNKKIGKFAELNRKWKIPVFVPNYFRGQKGVPEKNLYMVVKRKHAAYGRIKNYGQYM